MTVRLWRGCWELVLPIMYGCETDMTFGVSPVTSQTGLPTCSAPGCRTTWATCVGAVSVTVYSPGHAWKFVPMVRNRGL